MARKSCVSDATFEKGDRVVSLLARARAEDGGEEQEVARIDALESELDRIEAPGEEICRWTQTFKPRRKDDREDQEAMKLTADNLFMSLFEGEEGGEPSEENAQLKHFLALMLERKRILRLKARGKRFNVYLHRPSKQEYRVPVVELDPQFFLENQQRLSFLSAGAEESDEKDEEESASPKANFQG